MKWKTIIEFPDYEVSDTGLVRSNRKPIDNRKNRLKCPYILKPARLPKGYLFVGLSKKNSLERGLRTIHRLVAKTFIDNPNNLSDVAHKDGCPSNNNVLNLRWSSHKDNQMDMRKHGTMQDGERCVTGKLKEKQVLEILKKLEITPKRDRKKVSKRIRSYTIVNILY